MIRICSVFESLKNQKRELAEWFKAASLSLAKYLSLHMFESYTLCIHNPQWGCGLKKIRYYKKQVSVRWLVASFGLEIVYVRIIITWKIFKIFKISYNIGDMYPIHLDKIKVSIKRNYYGWFAIYYMINLAHRLEIKEKSYN